MSQCADLKNSTLSKSHLNVSGDPQENVTWTRELSFLDFLPCSSVLMQPTVLEPHLVTAAHASLTFSGVTSHFFLAAELCCSDQRKKVSVFHTVWPFVKWALVWLCFHGPQLISLSHTLPSPPLPLQKSVWLEKTIFKGTFCFLSLFLLDFHYPPTGKNNLTLLPNQQKFSISWKLSSSAPEISLITSNSQCDIWIIFQRLRRQEKTHLFIFYKSTYVDFQALLAWSFSEVSCHVWDMGFYLKGPPRIPLSRHSILLWRLTPSSGCCQGDAHSPFCLHDLQSLLSFHPIFSPEEFSSWGGVALSCF